MKYKETFKTIILITLIICSVNLTMKIWFSEELWSGDYNSFNYERNPVKNIISVVSSWFKDGKSYYTFDYNQILFPKQVLIFKNSKRELVMPNSSHFADISNDSQQIIENIFDNASVAEVTADDLQKSYKSSSVYIDFYNDLSFSEFGSYLGKTVSAQLQQIKSFKHILISLTESTSNEISIYINDTESKKNYKIVTTGSIESIDKKSDDILKSKGENLNLTYSFVESFDTLATELNQGAEFMNSIIPMDSYAVINLSTSELSGMEKVIQLSSEIISSANTDFIAKLLNSFEINITSSRRYTDSDGTLNFIENYAELKVHKDGLLEYSAVNPEKGIKLDLQTNSPYDIVKEVGKTVNEINSQFTPISNNNLVYKGFETTDTKNIYKLLFDTLANGVPVTLERPLSNGGSLNHCIEVIVDNDRIISYRQLFVQYKSNNDKFIIPPTPIAFDEFYVTYKNDDKKDLVIEDISNVYLNRADSEKLKVKWVFSLSNGENVFVNIPTT